MTTSQWDAFVSFRDAFKEKCRHWALQAEKLHDLQAAAAQKDGVPSYPIENPVVYNTALDSITPDSDINILVIGDNPGKDEQLSKNRAYLVGQSGKIADGFFRRNPELETDFRKNVIILNKTPLHTAKTKELLFLIKSDATAAALLAESQVWMAEHTAKLHQALSAEKKCSLWLVGYAELKARGLFLQYKDALFNAYTCRQTDAHAMLPAYESLFVFQHFSMNRFLIDLKQHTDPDNTLRQNIEQTGIMHRKEIFGA